MSKFDSTGSTPVARAKREHRVRINTAAAIAGQALSMACQFLLIRILLDALGEGRYGIWITMTSTLAALSLAQVGAGPSLVNSLSAATDLGDERRTLVSSALAIQCLIAGVGCLLVVLIVPWIPWSRVFNSAGLLDDRTVMWATMLVAAGGFLKLPFILPAYIFKALQLGYKESLLGASGTLLALIAIASASRWFGTLVTLAGAQQLAFLIAGFAAWVYLWVAFGQLRPSLAMANVKTARVLGKTGAHFSLVSLASYLILSSDSLVISHVLGPESVTPYAVTLTICQIAIRFTVLLLDAAWPAWSEAAARRDMAWLRGHFWRVTGVCLLVLALAATSLMLVGRPLVRWWAGTEAAVPSVALLAAMTLTMFVQGAFMSASHMVTALGAPHVVGRVGLLNALINIPASILLAKQFGLPGIALGTTTGYLLTNWVMPLFVRRKFRELEAAQSPTS